MSGVTEALATQSNKPRPSSRIPDFFRLSVAERTHTLKSLGHLDDADLALLDEAGLQVGRANGMIENVIGVFGLPLGLGLNFLVNGIDRVVPLVVEEPSIVAGLSGAARLFRLSGGFQAEASDPLLIGQVQVGGIADAQQAAADLTSRSEEIIGLANSLHPKMLARGGGAKAIEVHTHATPSGEMLVLHLIVDTRDAMGANLVNTMCEGIASLVESITGGRVFLRILSNLSDRALVTARAVVSEQNLEGKGYSGAEVRDGIILANDLAIADPYRATTHNKGIMNGVDPVAIATGNDWRAIEAAAHAYAARSGRYQSLTKWYKTEDGHLAGEICMPMKVGTVGGSLESNPLVKLCYRLLGSPDARALAEIMGAVGLAQNFAALRALSTVGIQQGHMTLHARSVALSAEVPAEHFDQVVDELIECEDIKVWKAKEILQSIRGRAPGASPSAAHVGAKEARSQACGKIVLMGEHAVVYGRHALAAPIPLAVEARVKDATSGIQLLIPRWNIEQRVPSLDEHPQGTIGILALVLRQLRLESRSMMIEVFPAVPKAMGLGGSAALAVAVIRALDLHFSLGLDDARVNELAFECETAAHGNPSGIDNTVATYGETLLFQSNRGAPQYSRVAPSEPVPLVIGISGRESLTARMVSQVAAARAKRPQAYDRIFDQIEAYTMSAVSAFTNGDMESLGETMNLCHGLLNGLQVSSPEIERMVHAARKAGALGAKVTGGGGGGSMIALTPDCADEVSGALASLGYETMKLTIEASA
ncbi:MAG: hydroxymethylglutaryl-CoA reductase, degradative [Gammaproteobacteria bacterium]|nr:hydroxymethylglutaryl-CoA reductase, degradative [Gammaproteobacteria bacterium]